MQINAKPSRRIQLVRSVDFKLPPEHERVDELYGPLSTIRERRILVEQRVGHRKVRRSPQSWEYVLFELHYTTGFLFIRFSGTVLSLTEQSDDLDDSPFYGLQNVFQVLRTSHKKFHDPEAFVRKLKNGNVPLLLPFSACFLNVIFHISHLISFKHSIDMISILNIIEYTKQNYLFFRN